IHPMKFDYSNESFSPVTLTGDGKALLEFYTDPKIRALLTSMGRYQRLAPSEQYNRAQCSTDQSATAPESKPEDQKELQPESDERSQ
ncbi:MAG: hypothetical protein ACQKBU_01090, partial [Verrucomicrobiales bacterium]